MIMYHKLNEFASMEIIKIKNTIFHLKKNNLNISVNNLFDFIYFIYFRLSFLRHKQNIKSFYLYFTIKLRDTLDNLCRDVIKSYSSLKMLLSSVNAVFFYANCASSNVIAIKVTSFVSPTV